MGRTVSSDSRGVLERPNLATTDSAGRFDKVPFVYRSRGSSLGRGGGSTLLRISFLVNRGEERMLVSLVEKRRGHLSY